MSLFSKLSAVTFSLVASLAADAGSLSVSNSKGFDSNPLVDSNGSLLTGFDPVIVVIGTFAGEPAGAVPNSGETVVGNVYAGLLAGFTPYGAPGVLQQPVGPLNLRGVFSFQDNQLVAATPLAGKPAYVVIAKGATLAAATEVAILKINAVFDPADDESPFPKLVGVGTGLGSVTIIGSQSRFTAAATNLAPAPNAAYSLARIVDSVSDNADLADLTLSTGTLSPAFASSAITYTASVSNATDSIAVTPTVADSTATVMVNGTTVVSGSASAAIPLVVNSNIVTTVVTAQDGVTTRTYTITVTRAPLAWTYNAADEVPVSASGYSASGTATLALDFAPPVGTNLTVVNNTGLGFISGAFGNLTQGQAATLTFNGVAYTFVANYHGGTGNDLVLQWANVRPLAWGYNADGELGDGTVTTDSPHGRLVPVPVDATAVLAGKTVIALAAGANHSLALCADGTLAAWGLNAHGELGNDSTTESPVPVAVDRTGVLAGKTVIAVAAGSYHSLALCSDGTLAAWGANGQGRLGNDSTTQSNVPVAVFQSGVLAGKTVIAVAAGDSHNLALCSDGTLAGWGRNSEGQLGDNSTTESRVPVAVDRTGALAGKTVIALAAGYSHSLALCVDGTLAAWGNNGQGQLGNDSTTQSAVPVAVFQSGVLAGKPVIAVAAGHSHNLALCSDGTLGAWGYNGQGQLGDNSTTQNTVPVAVFQSGVLAGKTIIAVAAGYSHSLAQCSDGTVAAWGGNVSGQLGDNSTTQSLLPVAVSSSMLVAGERFVAAITGEGGNHNLALVASPPAPAATTLAATAITVTGATLNGTVNANNNSTDVSFDYGTTTGYGTSLAATPAQITGSSTTPVSASLTGLSPGTTYHFRVNGVSAAGATHGNDLTFTTSSSNNANLASLTLSAGTLTPDFATDTTSYTADVASSTDSITVTPTAADDTATVTVNGNGVTAGSASGALALHDGANPVEVRVTAGDGITVKTYTVTVIRPFPSITVLDGATTITDGSATPVELGTGFAGVPISKTFTIGNSGDADLTIGAITVDGPNAGDFSVNTTGMSTTVPPNGSTTFAVAFAPAATAVTGIRTAGLHIASNDGDENPFDLTLTGTCLSQTFDTDGDGLNDAAEFQLAALGYDWQVSQPTLVSTLMTNANLAGLFTESQMDGSRQAGRNDVTGSPNTFGLYTLSQVQALNVDAPLLAKDPATGKFKLTMDWKKSTDLTHFTDFPAPPGSTVAINPDGNIEFSFTVADHAAFFRLESR